MIKTKQGKTIKPGIDNGIYINDRFISNTELDMILSHRLDLLDAIWRG